MCAASAPTKTSSQTCLTVRRRRCGDWIVAESARPAGISAPRTSSETCPPPATEQRLRDHSGPWS
jgi:hypothetical protein